MKFQVKDISGQRFGRLTVVELTGKKTKSGNAIWLCQCDCGKFTEADSGSLRVGDKVSCGCYTKDRMSVLNKTHGGRNEKLYLVWMNMRRRCNDPKDVNYSNYGGRGIRICHEWENYAEFRKWAIASGYDPNAMKSQCTLDRIDVNGNYEPENCRWADLIMQANNKRTNRTITYNGKTQSMKQWSEELGIKYSLLQKRLYAGWKFEDAISKPLREVGRKDSIQSATAV